MDKTKRHELISDLSYFWTEKEDLERLCSFNRNTIKAEFPEVLKCWDDYKMARKILSSVIKTAYETEDRDFDYE